MVLDAAVQGLRKAEILKTEILHDNNPTLTPTDRLLTLTQLQKAYQKVLLMDLDYALDKKVEQELWNVGFKRQIEELTSKAADKKNPRRADSQVMLSWVLQAATGFYICLLHQICTAFKLTLPFRCSIPYPTSDVISPVIPRPPQASSCWYICQHCLVHLGDLARYSRQPRQADSFYRQALSVSPSNGQPYNQLGLLRAARGDKLGAAYYHARGLAVGGPFPPAANNLARTLAKADNPHNNKSILKDPSQSLVSLRLCPSEYVDWYILVHHQLSQGGHQLAEQPGRLSSMLTALVATNEFDSDTLIQMCCLDMYAVYSITEGHKLSPSALTSDEREAVAAAMELLAGGLVAFLLPAHTLHSDMLKYPALPAVKVLLEWVRLHPDVLKESSFVSRLQIWPGLCSLLNKLQEAIGDFSCLPYESIPLPEDEELQGYLPIDKAFSKLKFSNCASSPLFKPGNTELLTKPTSDRSREKINNSKKEPVAKVKHGRLSEKDFKNDKHLMDCLRADRLIQIGVWLVDYQKDNGFEYIIISDKGGKRVFSAVQNTLESNPDVVRAMEQLSLLREKQLQEARERDLFTSIQDTDDTSSDTDCKATKSDSTADVSLSESTTTSMLPPIVISEADFREKVMEKRAGILKPQGSLERARGEKALSRAARIDAASPETITGNTEQADTADLQDTASSSSTVSQDGPICSDIVSLLEPVGESMKRDSKRMPRTNVAMQAIMRKQEETSKQVKFLTPVTTPDSMCDSNQVSPSLSKDVEKKKIVQPKVMKSLATIPTDRKTGGILSLKDKSAGYPHLVKAIEESKPENTSISAENIEKVEKTEESGDAAVSKRISHNEGQLEATGNYATHMDKFKTSPYKKIQTPNNNTNHINKNLNPSLTALEQMANSVVGEKGNYVQWSDGSNKLRHSVIGDGEKTPKQLTPVKSKGPRYFSYFSSPDKASNITLPVVNPKEIDVRSVALQKQRSAQFGMGDGPNVDAYGGKETPNKYWYPPPSNPAFSSHNRNMNLPPRLQAANSKLKEFESYNPNAQSSNNWPQNTQHPLWWKNTNDPSIRDPEYYPNQYENHPYGPSTSEIFPTNIPPPNIAPMHQNPYTLNTPPYVQNYNQYPKQTGFSSSMYPQFGSHFGMSPNYPQEQQYVPSFKASLDESFSDRTGMVSSQGPSEAQGSSLLSIGSNISLPDLPAELLNPNFDSPEFGGREKTANDPYNSFGDPLSSGNTYSLFSGGSTWNSSIPKRRESPTSQQSLWSGPGPSPLERLLEQQKQYKYPPPNE